MLQVKIKFPFLCLLGQIIHELGLGDKILKILT